MANTYLWVFQVRFRVLEIAIRGDVLSGKIWVYLHGFKNNKCNENRKDYRT